MRNAESTSLSFCSWGFGQIHQKGLRCDTLRLNVSSSAGYTLGVSCSAAHVCLPASVISSMHKCLRKRGNRCVSRSPLAAWLFLAVAASGVGGGRDIKGKHKKNSVRKARNID